MREGLARAIPSNAEAGILGRLWTDQDQYQQMECRGRGDLPYAREDGHRRPASTRPKLQGDSEILDRP